MIQGNTVNGQTEQQPSVLSYQSLVVRTRVFAMLG
jgi:hypothetical protein